MTLHADALAVLSAMPPSPLRDRYVEHLRRHEDGLLRDCRPDHITASMLVLSHDHARVLLTLHGKAQQWFQFGGHCEPSDTTLAGAATREALEESGLAAIEVDPVPIHLDEHEVPFCTPAGRAGEPASRPSRPTRHLDVRFLGVAHEGAEHAVSEESIDVRWWPVDGLPTDEPSMRELVRCALLRAVDGVVAGIVDGAVDVVVAGEAEV